MQASPSPHSVLTYKYVDGILEKRAPFREVRTGS